ncbi:MAG TPA: RNA methyltransferase PUA domain-containing protein, partial [Burkholderiaceae bacterium]
MPARLFVPVSPLVVGAELDLPEGASRHAQVLRLQPGAALTLFDGTGAEWSAEVVQ